MPLFERVDYSISESLPAQLRGDIASLLDANGANKVPLDRATHVVSDTVEFDGRDALKEGVACVTPYWVERSMELGQLQDPKCFSADQTKIFSGVVATSAGIPPGDKEVLAAGIKESGGQWREGLTRDVNHLFVTNTHSEKYQTAMHFRDSAHITILLPQWFDQCFNMQMRLPTDTFTFPDPLYMHKTYDGAAYTAQMLQNKNEKHKQTLFRAMRAADGSSRSSPAPAAAAGSSPPNIWQGRTILLSASLALDGPRRETVETRIRRSGGQVVAVADDEDESEAVDRADVLVTRFRAGPAYGKALADGKTIGTLAWLFYVEKVGIVTRPRDQLLHYPVRSRPIEGFADHVITVTNYQGDARDYLKKLIEVMGARFTPTMSGKNTIVIAAHKGGNKTAKADEWSVPVVTHKWLEDCFVEWRNLTPAQKKYLDYAPAVNYGTVLGERGVGHVGLEEDPELPPEKGGAPRARDAAAAQKPKAEKKPENKDAGAEGVTRTGTSTREAREAEEVENALDLGDEAYPEEGDDVQDVQMFTPAKVGPPRGIKKTPVRKDAAPVISTMRPEARPKLKPISSEGTAVDGRDGEAGASSPPQKPKPASKKDVPMPDGSDDEFESGGSAQEEPRGQPKAKPKPLPRPRAADKTNKVEGSVMPKPKPLSAKKLAPASSESDEGSGADKDEPVFVGKGKGKALPPRKALATRGGGDDDEMPKVKPKTQAKAPVSKKTREMPPIRVNSDDEGSGGDDMPIRVASKPSPKTYKSNSKASTKGKFPPSESDSDEVQEVLPKKGAGGSKTVRAVDKAKSKLPGQGAIPSQNRIVAVELPDPRSLLSSIGQRSHTPERGSTSGSKPTTLPGKASPGALARTTSLRAAAYEAPTSTPKRGRPLLRRDSDVSPSPTPPPRRSPRRSAAAKSNARKAATSTSRSSSPPLSPLPFQRTPSSRVAAALATQKLRDEVMPDVINFQNEQKRGNRKDGRRKSSISTSKATYEEDEESEGEIRGQKRRKIGKDEGAGAKGKKTATKGPGTDDFDASVKFVTHVKKAKRSAPADEEDEVGPSKRATQTGARKKARMETSPILDRSDDEARSSASPKQIRILCTKIELSDEVRKAVEKLGPKFTNKATDCTHLVATSFARTQKFLSALPNDPFVLHSDWLHACAKKKKIVAESGHYLKDSATEARYDFKLADSLERARELKRKRQKLLQGHFFYITPRVSIEFSLLKSVLATLGAECQKSATVSSRNLSVTRHMVSCPEDAKIWRPLAQQFPIYTHELVLMAALLQYIDWDDKNNRVPGSS